MKWSLGQSDSQTLDVVLRHSCRLALAEALRAIQTNASPLIAISALYRTEKGALTDTRDPRGSPAVVLGCSR